MPDLRNSLSRMDFNQLKIVAEKWRLPFSAPDAREGVNQLIDHLLDFGALQEILETLTTPEKEALLWLDSLDGKEPWTHFARRFGEIREMGAGRLDRERPDRDPISPAEGLWYRALVARGFFETDSGPLEFAYIPEDIRGLMMIVLNPGNSSQSREFICRKAVLRERKHLLPASDICLDHTCTLLSAWRMNLDPDVHLPGVSQNEVDFYRTLFATMTLLADDGTPAPEKIRNFFDKPLGERFLLLWQSWRESDIHQDLSLTPDIQIEGILELDPCRVRELLISLLKDLDPETWWSIESFISQIKEKYPDFQRTGGDYDSWYIKSKSTGEYIRGFNHWDDVEGELLKYLLTGPMHWLGLLDLGLVEEDGQPASFRFSAYAGDLFNMQVPSIAVRKPETVQIRSKGEIRMTMNVPHKTRYQVSRFCEWYPVKAEAYLYAISPASLSRAEKQGLRVAHLLSLLTNYAEAIPPNILAALERWEKQGVQSSVAQKTILRLGSPAVLKSLKKSKASRYILEQIGPTVVIIREGSEDKIAEVLVELGFFLELED
ncbi:MAG: hypothetical protein GQ562_00830 [Anaerolineales bacterium]|nr:hypothetical protein [Anaerolineales bacterium]